MLMSEAPHQHKLGCLGTSVQTHSCWFCIHGACSQDDSGISPAVLRNGKMSARSPGV